MKITPEQFIINAHTKKFKKNLFLVSGNEETLIKKIQEMLYPTVMVDVGRDGQGSGTIIFSGEREHESWKEEKVWTLVLTNHHVIQRAEAAGRRSLRCIQLGAISFPTVLGK